MPAPKDLSELEERFEVEWWGVDRAIPYARNARKISQLAVDKVAASLTEFGWKQPIVVDADGVIVVGHVRHRAARQLGRKRVPVLVARDLNPQQIKAYRLMDNRSHEEVEWDKDLLAIELTELKEDGADLSLTGFDLPEIEDLYPEEEDDDDGDGEEKPDPMDKGDEEFELEYKTEGLIYAYREDAIFPSSNKWGIPDLREDMLAGEEVVATETWFDWPLWPETEHAMYVWSKIKAENFRNHGRELGRGVLCFYEDDAKFEDVWYNAVKWIEVIKEHQFGGVVSPDFSLWYGTPLCLQLFSIYRGKWCARYWQEAGIKIIPNLSWCGPESLEFATAGVPKGAPVCATQFITFPKNNDGKDRFIQGITTTIEAVMPKTVLMYGGAPYREEFEKILPAGVNYVWLHAWRHLFFSVRNNLMKQSGGVMPVVRSAIPAIDADRMLQR